jgi:hypothetical protein
MADAESPMLPSPEVVLERESRVRRKAGIAGLVAGALALLAGVAPQAIYNDFPHVFLLESLRDAAGQDIGRTGLKTAQILFYDDKAVPLVLVAVAQAITAAGMGYLLLFLLGGAQDRGAKTPRFARVLVLFGATATAVGALGLQLGVMIRAADFAGSSDQGTAAAHDVLRSGIVVAASAVGGIGNIAMAGGAVMVAMGAMRVGLLTRFLGVLGAIVGALLVLGPLSGSPTFIIQTFWLLLVGALLLGLWPRGVPPAWTLGEAVPWPSQQELREQREREGGGGRTRGGRGGRSARPDDPRDEPVAGGGASPAARRKKRKRRG